MKTFFLLSAGVSYFVWKTYQQGICRPTLHIWHLIRVRSWHSTYLLYLQGSFVCPISLFFLTIFCSIPSILPLLRYLFGGAVKIPEKTCTTKRWKSQYVIFVPSLAWCIFQELWQASSSPNANNANHHFSSKSNPLSMKIFIKFIYSSHELLLIEAALDTVQWL